MSLRERLQPLVAIAASVGLVAGGAVGIVGLAATPAAAATTTVVSSGAIAPANPIGAWALANNTGTYAFVAGPATPPGGAGSLEMTIGGHESLYNYQYGACATGPACTNPLASWTDVSAVDALGFSTYRASGTTFPSLNVEVDYAGTGLTYTTFVFIPDSGLITTGSWQTWNALNPAHGTWYSTTNIGSGPFNCVFQAAGCDASWAQIQAAYPSAKIKFGLGPNVGSGGTFAGNIDNFTVGVSGSTTIFDFEPACTTVCYVSNSGSDSSTGSSPGQAFLTIQHGVNTVSAGGTVHVAAGTYQENVTVPKSVNITGAGNTTIVRPATSDPNCGGGGGGSLCAGAVNVFLVQANNVTIDHVKIEGDNPSLLTGINVGGANIDARNGIITDHTLGTFNNLSVHDVTIDDIFLRGVYASSGGSFNFTNNTVDNVQGDPASIALFNFGGAGVMNGNHVSNANDAVSSNHSAGVMLTNNVVTSSGSGVHTDNAGDGGGTADVLSGNNVSACTPGGYGVWAYVPYLAPTITNNVVSGCEVGLAAFASCTLGFVNVCPGSLVPTVLFTNNTVTYTAGGAGLYATTNSFGFGDGQVKVDANHNTISGPGSGVLVEETGGAVATTAINRNSLAGNTTFGIENTGATSVAATCNWWGAANGPGVVGPGTGSKVTAGVSFQGWLLSSNLNGGCPSAPTITSTSSGGPTSVIVNFTPAANSGTPRSFTVTCVSLIGDPTVSASGPGSPITVTGLVHQHPYQCTVTETNPAGTSAPSSATGLVWPGGGVSACGPVPSAPTKLSTAPGNASATVSWWPSTSGCVAGYLVTPYVGSVAQPSTLVVGHETTTVVKGLTNGVTYRFTVSGENGVKAGPESEFTGSIVVGVPGAASALKAVKAGKGALKITFKTPVANGAPITRYTATCKSTNGGAAKVKTAAKGPITVTGLSPGKTYRCTVRATNRRGTGRASAASGPVKA